ncbi:DUF1778 domain-containing protein [Mesorhizobium sp. VK23B]|uniref:DUF1778 domain-containing protein n=1 Tax=Mesorhizobium dulcispinae TaxID=3072316 RepID=A0ABU4XGZ3_9HYPH|nr:MULTISPECIES: DUF1778 domain-containing protein [unclassified Mesorhizobium]MDX8467705.1 DUF1778 domain-containing protein [Mesorhizobium sp. VK23B]MDX8474043.1 DUF1778 domain-containing protein [Mesorhizobium sp. VK23A]MDX8521042.1 DUF1778 domain-containing protein [Mesorhizobium sp. VK23D]
MKNRPSNKAREQKSDTRIELNMVLDRTLIAVSPEAYAEFVVQLDTPSKHSERLSRLMNAPLPWKSD